MLFIEDSQALRLTVTRWRKQGEAVAFVPTMGNLHEGHISLVRLAKTRAQRCVVSLFVNPTQFGPKEDFSAYPRTLAQDRQACGDNQVDVLFAPAVASVYPNGTQGNTFVEVPGLSDILCGAFRPGHFRGVATVVNTLLNLVQPDLLLLGEKDYQQLLVIKRMLADLSIPVRLLSAPTLREADGLAMSSRNQYLSAEERITAACLYETLQVLRNAVLDGDTGYAELERRGTQALELAGFKVDYVAIRNQQDLSCAQAGQEKIILAAAWLGRCRLIDNIFC